MVALVVASVYTGGAVGAAYGAVWGGVAAAKEYATQVNINRLETKIDELHQLLWEMHNEHTTRHKK